MQVIKLLVRSFRRLRLFFCGFLRGQPPLGMLLGLRKSRRIQNQPQADAQYNRKTYRNASGLTIGVLHNTCFV